jgi:hypothetical protein
MENSFLTACGKTFSKVNLEKPIAVMKIRSINAHHE